MSTDGVPARPPFDASSWATLSSANPTATRSATTARPSTTTRAISSPFTAASLPPTRSQDCLQGQGHRRAGGDRQQGLHDRQPDRAAAPLLRIGLDDDVAARDRD